MELVTKMFIRTPEVLVRRLCGADSRPTVRGEELRLPLPQRGREVLGDNVRRVDSLCL